ncbi:MAG: molybdopterin converting factor subunit 1 [Alcanivoracaceae bacterium]|nr:molybdopterin converting factor subunit 1 [Alcanivoracaceae bacterium]
MIQVQYFAALRERLQCEVEEIAYVETLSTVGDLRAHLAARGAPWLDALSSEILLMCAVNETMATMASDLKDGDSVAFFPPVTGG